ncbi:MAG: O-antigen ligase [Oscillospiraceae bacterium]|nr:O-antigen ligase [Oscillospiraceae bacterium]
MNFIFGIIQLIIILSVCVHEYKKTSPAVFMWVVLALLFSVPHFIGSISRHSFYPEIVLIKTSLFVIFFSLFYLATRIILDSKEKNVNVLFNNINIAYHKKRNYVHQPLFYVCLLSLIMVFIVFIVFVYINLGGIAFISWSDYRDISVTNKSMWFDILNQGIGILFLAFSGLIVYCLLTRDTKYIILCSVILLFPLIVTRARARLLYLICPFSIYLFFWYKKGKFHISKLFFLFFMLISFYYIIETVRAVRHYGSWDAFITKVNYDDLFGRVNSRILSDQGETRLREVFYFFMYKNNNFPNFNKFHTYNRMALVFIPTKLSMGIKAPDFAMSMWSAYYNDFSNKIGSMHPTLFGDCYANGNWFGVFLGVFWAFITQLVDRIIENKKILFRCLFASVFSYMFILIGRGAVYNAYVSALYAAITLYILLFVDYLFFKSKK